MIFLIFKKIEKSELKKIEQIVNEKIQEGIEKRVDIVEKEQAVANGARALFGEKYGDKVRVVTFDEEFSKELCGGTHIENTRLIGIFIITAEKSVASGIRRIEAITSSEALLYLQKKSEQLDLIAQIIGNGKNIPQKIEGMIKKNKDLEKKITETQNIYSQYLEKHLLEKKEIIHNTPILFAHIKNTLEGSILKLLSHSPLLKTENGLLILSTEKGNSLQIVISSGKDSPLSAEKISEFLISNYNFKGGGNEHYKTLVVNEKFFNKKKYTLKLKNMLQKTLLRITLVSLILSFTTSFAHSQESKKKKQTNSKHALGITTNVSYGSGLSYRRYGKKIVLQITALPIFNNNSQVDILLWNFCSP